MPNSKKTNDNDILRPISHCLTDTIIPAQKTRRRSMVHAVTPVGVIQLKPTSERMVNSLMMNIHRMTIDVAYGHLLSALYNRGEMRYRIMMV